MHSHVERGFWKSEATREPRLLAMTDVSHGERHNGRSHVSSQAPVGGAGEAMTRVTGQDRGPCQSGRESQHLLILPRSTWRLTEARSLSEASETLSNPTLG